MAEIRVIAMPYEHDRLRYGVGRGPEHLLESGAEEALASAGASVTTQWIELDPDQEDEIDACFELIAKIATAVREARAAGAFPVVLSGSCFAGVGVVAGLDEPTPAVIYFDAHGDFNDPDGDLRLLRRDASRDPHREGLADTFGRGARARPLT